jgi:hypothetical protein
LPITLIAYLFTARSDAGNLSHDVSRALISSAFCNLTHTFRSLPNTSKSIEEISTILLPMVWHKISLCHWWSEHRTAAPYVSRMCGEKFLYGTFRISQRIDFDEMWVEVIFLLFEVEKWFNLENYWDMLSRCFALKDKNEWNIFREKKIKSLGRTLKLKFFQNNVMTSYENSFKKKNT